MSFITLDQVADILNRSPPESDIDSNSESENVSEVSYHESNSEESDIFEDIENMDRRNFVMRLGVELAEPHMRRRLLAPTLQRNVRDIIYKIINIDEKKNIQPIQEAAASTPSTSKRKRCSVCPAKRDRKGNKTCRKCSAVLCGECVQVICPKCADDLL